MAIPVNQGIPMTQYVYEDLLRRQQAANSFMSSTYNQIHEHRPMKAADLGIGPSDTLVELLNALQNECVMIQLAIRCDDFEGITERLDKIDALTSRIQRKDKK